MTDLLQEEAAFTKALILNPLDRTARLVFSDWLLEQGRDDEAAEQRRCATDKWEASYRNLAHLAEQIKETVDDLLVLAQDYLSSFGTVNETEQWNILLPEVPADGRWSDWDWHDFWNSYAIYTGKDIEWGTFSDPCGCGGGDEEGEDEEGSGCSYC